MPSGLSLVIDKSTLQGLSSDEIRWLGEFFFIVLTPTLFMEIRADLLKASLACRDPEQEVANLAEKLPGYASILSMDHYNLSIHNLLGDPVEMRGRPLVGGGRSFTSKDGRRGVLIDEPPEMRSLTNWTLGKFTDEDWEFAREWREELSRTDLNMVREALAWSRRYTTHLKSDEDVLDMVDQSLGIPDRSHQTELLTNCINLIRVPKLLHARIIQKWQRAGQPMVGIFAPYATHVARVDMFFYSALARGLLSPDSPSDRVDMSYLYYLPFCKIFASSDKLHKRVTPLFVYGERLFVDGQDLKADLAKMSDYYNATPTEQKRTDFPPLKGAFLVSELYDQLWPGWREIAMEPPTEITPEMNERIMEHLRPMLDAIKDLDDETR